MSCCPAVLLPCCPAALLLPCYPAAAAAIAVLLFIGCQHVTRNARQVVLTFLVMYPGAAYLSGDVFPSGAGDLRSCDPFRTVRARSGALLVCAVVLCVLWGCACVCSGAVRGG